jgi:hypothetical protein
MTVHLASSAAHLARGITDSRSVFDQLEEEFFDFT